MKIKNIIASLTIIGVMMAGTAFAMPNDSTQATESAKTIESLSPQELEKWNDLHDNHIEKTRKIRSEFKSKRMELRALKYNAKVTPDYISDLTKDIIALQNRLDDMNKEFLEASEKKFDLDFSSMGRGYYGMHNGHNGMHGAMHCSQGTNNQNSELQNKNTQNDTTKHNM